MTCFCATQESEKVIFFAILHSYRNLDYANIQMGKTKITNKQTAKNARTEQYKIKDEHSMLTMGRKTPTRTQNVYAYGSILFETDINSSIWGQK